MKTLFSLFVLFLIPGIMSFAQNPRNVVLYDLTSTDCGHCSCMDSIIRELILKEHPRTIPIALHSPYMGSHFKDYQGIEIFETFNSHFAPDGFVDGLGRELTWHQTPDSVADRYTKSPDAPALITVTSKSWDPAGRNVAITLDLTNISNELPGSYWYNIFVTESNLKFIHRIELGCATPDDPGGLPFRENYINNHVIRKLEFFAHGDSLIGPSWPAGEKITRSWTVHIDSGWVEQNTYLNFVVYYHADSLYKSEVQQAISECVTGGMGINPRETSDIRGISRIYPNPATELVNIHFSVQTPGNYSLEMFNSNGKLVDVLFSHWFDPGIYNAEYHLTDLTIGIYHCRLTMPDGNSEKKLIVL